MESPLITKKPFAILFTFIGVLLAFIVPLDYLDRIELFKLPGTSEYSSSFNQFSGIFAQLIFVFIFGILGFLFGMGVDHLVNRSTSPNTT